MKHITWCLLLICQCTLGKTGNNLTEASIEDISGNPYLFKDWCNGTVRFSSGRVMNQFKLKFDVLKNQLLLQFNGSAWLSTERTSQISTNAGAINFPTSFGEDAKGNLYIVDYDGDVFRLTPQVVSADRDDTLRGFAGDDTMFGGSGNDLLDGGTGKDAMTGGPGNDRFVFSPGYGADLITDFVAGAGSDDRIDLTAFANLKLSYVLANTTQAGANAPAGGGNLLVIGAGDALLKIDQPGCGEGRVRVRRDGSHGHVDRYWRLRSVGLEQKARR